jgi:hypothetical protein
MSVSEGQKIGKWLKNSKKRDHRQSSYRQAMRSYTQLGADHLVENDELSDEERDDFKNAEYKGRGCLGLLTVVLASATLVYCM